MERSSIVWVLRFDGILHMLAGLALRIFAPAILSEVSWPGRDLMLYLQVLSSTLILLSLAGLLASYEPEGSRDTILASVVAKALVSCLGLYALAFGGLGVALPSVLLGMLSLQLVFAALEATFLFVSKGAFPASLRLEGNR